MVNCWSCSFGDVLLPPERTPLNEALEGAVGPCSVGALGRAPVLHAVGANPPARPLPPPGGKGRRPCR